MAKIAQNSLSDPRVQRTHRAVADAVLSILVEEGWDAVTHVRVAERSGIGRTTLYRHWPERVDLLRHALVDHSMASNVVPTGDLRSDIVAELNAMVCDLLDNRLGLLLAALIDRSEWSTSLNRMKATLIAEGVASLRELLHVGRASGRLRVDTDIERAVAELVGPITFRRFVSGEPLSERFITGIVDDFLASHRG